MTTWLKNHFITIILIVLGTSALFGIHILENSLDAKISEKNKLKSNKLEDLYKKQTPGFDRLMLTAFDSEMPVSGDKVRVIGVDVLNFWLKDSDGKRKIKSIASFDRGVQGSTSSFLIVYTDLK